MYWKISKTDNEAPVDDFTAAGRFVLHRHTDAEGPHLDLRIETDGHLRGWRIDGVSLDNSAWATEKAPHPLRWLDDDGDAERMDAGEYAWERREADGGTLVLRGVNGDVRVDVTRAHELPATDARSIADTLWGHAVAPGEASRLIVDGLNARRRATERLCALGRELDGDAFEEGVWRDSLDGLALDAIHAQLRAFEVRFDAKYPPQPVSQPAAEDSANATRAEKALEIVRS